MNIRYLDQSEKNKIRPLYEEIFEDPPIFLDYFFERSIRDNDVLVLEMEEEIVAMLQLIPKKICHGGHMESVHYIYAVATAKAHRKKGYMEHLLEKAFEDLKQKGEAFTYLVPVNPEVYKKFGFKMTYLRPKFKLEPVEGMIKVHEPGRMDAIILSKIAPKILEKKYDTYLVHDVEYFEKIFHELTLDGGFLVYHSKGNQIRGYSLATSDGTVFESLFMEQPKELTLTGYTPWIMVKILSEDCKIGRLCINDET